MREEYFVTEETAGDRIDKFLAEQYENLSRSFLQKLLKSGEVMVDGRPVKASYKVAEGDLISFEVPEAVEPDVAGGYRRLTTEKLCEISWNLFQLYTKDPVVSNIRKLLMREQFSNSIIAKKYNQFFLNGVVERQAQTFAALVEDGVFRKEDTKIIALQFYGPIFLLFQRYDCEPEQEEAIKRMLYEHVRAFGRNYSRKEEQAL